MTGPGSEGRSPASPFAPPASPAPSTGPDAREVVTFFLVRAFVFVIGPAMFALVPVLLGVGSPAAALVGASIGAALWAPSSLLLFRILFFPGPPDAGLYDATGRPACARDLRIGLAARAAEHVLGTAPLLLLIPYAWRAFEPALATVISIAVLAWVVWRELVHAGGVLVEDAEVLLHTGHAQEALARVSLATRWLPRTGDAATLLLARARFRTGDARGAVDALDRIRDRRAFHADLLRAQMGITFLPPAEIEAARATAARDPDTAPVADVLSALALLHADRPLPEDLLVRLEEAGASEGRGLSRLLAAAGRADTDPDAARSLLADRGRDAGDLGHLRAVWPAVARALEGVTGA